MSKFIIDYVWVGGNGELRSKTRVIWAEQNLEDIYQPILNCYGTNFIERPTFLKVPRWNYDGSSTNQAKSDGDTEVILDPIAVFDNPFYNKNAFIVFCETLDKDMNPIPSNSYRKAYEIFNKYGYDSFKPWFGLEQEYFIRINENNSSNNLGLFYCGTGFRDAIERKIVNEHLEACIRIGLEISGTNAEVSPGQWEFQIGPVEGINAGIQLYIARFLLERIAEKYNAIIDYSPKPNPDINGSGCHINFSTTDTRKHLYGKHIGLNYIMEYIEKLKLKHQEHIEVYGKNNEKRLTGLHETSSISNFSYGVGTRNTSIRIPNQVFNEKCGYLEDRRPAANIDPFLATSKIFETCCSL